MYIYGVTSHHRYLECPTAADTHMSIEALWETSILRDGSYLVLPDGRMDLVIRCDEAAPSDARVASIAIVGPSSLPTKIPVKTGQRFLGARFRPGFGACLGVLPASVINDAVRGDNARRALRADTTDLIGASGLTEVRKALLDVANHCASPFAPPAPSTLRAVDLLHASAGRATVSELSELTSIPERTLRRRIQQAVGLTPKVFAGVLRFQQAMRQLERLHAEGLAEVAAECGYSDQAHLTREFQRFGGFTPGRRLPATLVTFPLGHLAD